MSDFFSSLRVAVATMAICVVGYTAALHAFAQAVTPTTANGSLLTREDGSVIGSRLIAQAFTSPAYVWPRPSAVDYDAAGAGGSNLSPTSPEVRERAETLISAYGGATEQAPIPADLVTASGAGLDPHISLAGALFQAPRVAAARGVEAPAVTAIIGRLAYSPGAFFTGDKIVNVLELNMALDAELAAPSSAN